MPDSINSEFRRVAVSELQQHPDNPRQGDVGAIYESIDENGFFGALVVDARNGNILAGNHRYHAAVNAGMSEVDVIFVDVRDDAHARKIMLADNRTSDLAVNDVDALAALLTGLALGDTGLRGTGFDGDDLDALRADIARAGDLLDLDDAESAADAEDSDSFGKAAAGFVLLEFLMSKQQRSDALDALNVVKENIGSSSNTAALQELIRYYLQNV